MGLPPQSLPEGHCPSDSLLRFAAVSITVISLFLPLRHIEQFAQQRHIQPEDLQILD